MSDYSLTCGKCWNIIGDSIESARSLVRYLEGGH